MANRHLWMAAGPPTAMTPLDYGGFALYVALYGGYHLLYFLLSRHTSGLMTREAIIAGYREAWFRHVQASGQLILAIQTNRNMVMTHTFLASITLVMMGGIFSYFFANLDLVDLLDTGRYVDVLAEHAPMAKLLAALLVLLVSLANFLFALRVCFNLNFTLGAPANAEGDLSFQLEMLQRQARHFIVGVRSLYFTVPLLLWVLHPTLLVLAAVMLTLSLFRFDFLKGPRAIASSA